jgi:DNA-directed RNA polymerase subunit F
MPEREFSVGKIVDLIPNSLSELDVCVWFEKARVVPVSISERVLQARDISVAIGKSVIAKISTDAEEELYFNPTEISEIK